MMGLREACFTETEYRAFTLLFDTIQQVLGQDEYRLVDPFGKIEHLFEEDESAGEFLKKLIVLKLVEFLFHGGEAVDGRRRETYRAYQDQWLEAATLVRRVPDPPLSSEDRALREVIKRRREQRRALAERRTALAKELAQVDEGIALADKELAEAEAARSELADWRKRIAALTASAAQAV